MTRVVNVPGAEDALRGLVDRILAERAELIGKATEGAIDRTADRLVDRLRPLIRQLVDEGLAARGWTPPSPSRIDGDAR